MFQKAISAILAFLTTAFSFLLPKAKPLPPMEPERTRYLFLDDHWIAAQGGVTRRFFAAEKEAGNPVLVKGKERGVGPYAFGWGRKTAPYTAWVGSYDGKKGEYPAFLITSQDGLHWDEARRETDVMCSLGNVQGAAYLYDPSGSYPGYPYLAAVLYRRTLFVDHFHARFRRSKDGVHWEKFCLKDPVWDSTGDVLSFLWDAQKQRYVAYYKIYRIQGTTTAGKPFLAYSGSFDLKKGETTARFKGYARMAESFGTARPVYMDVELAYGGDQTNDGGGLPTDETLRIQRVIGYADSVDFLRWENEQIVIVPPEGAPLGDQGYGMVVTRRNGMYVGMYQYFNSLSGVIDLILAWSYDGIRWELNWDERILVTGAAGAWDHGMVFGPEFMDGGGGRMFLYYGSLGVDHTQPDGPAQVGGV
ncbi:MAG: hypothetical protein FWF60_08350, partial [Oscillospiraceae bacterium]|nr:hypothetical protein [Oscillospiraceae bacterium]